MGIHFADQNFVIHKVEMGLGIIINLTDKLTIYDISRTRYHYGANLYLLLGVDK
jgi:hypothetical protein